MAASVINEVTMRPRDLETYLEFVLNNRDEHFVPCICGAPGIGKSDIVMGAAGRAGYELMISHAVTSDPTDYKGLPAVVDKCEATFLIFSELKKLLETKKPLVCFFDDVGQAIPATQAALMQLLLLREINGHKISPYVMFILATNRRQDKAGVTALLEPVKGRSVMVTLEPSKDDYIAWALAHDVPPEIIAFCNFRPSYLFETKPTTAMTNSPCPRTITAVGRHLRSGLPKNLERTIFTGCAGEAFASEFLGFVQIYRDLPDKDIIIKDPGGAPVPEKLAVLYALSGLLAHEATPSNFANILKYANRMPVALSTLLVSDATKRNPELALTEAFTDWGMKNKDVVFG